jgi:hypothetical protein
MAYTSAPSKQMAALFVADLSRLRQIGIRGNCTPRIRLEEQNETSRARIAEAPPTALSEWPTIHDGGSLNTAPLGFAENGRAPLTEVGHRVTGATQIRQIKFRSARTRLVLAYYQCMVKGLLGGLRRLNSLLLIASAVSGMAAGQSLAEVKADLEKGANQIDDLQPLTVGSYPGVPANVAAQPYQSAVVRLAGSDYPASSLISLLSDTSPRVRTLALELLFRKQDPQFLPPIFEHASDPGITFEHIVLYNFRANGPPDSRRESQTVSDFAKAMLSFFGVRGDFSEFWNARKDRRYWFSWLRSRLLSIGGMSSPNPGLRERLLPFREMIESFPELDRNLYLIWLQAEYSEPALATDAEISEAVRRLGRENILAIAEGHPRGGDPDLQLSWEPVRYRYVTAIILDHAIGTLQPSDAARLAAIYQRETERLKVNHYVRDADLGTSYTIAQARLLPDRASEILHAEIRARNGPFDLGYREQLVAALFQLRGRAEMPSVREFFYGDGGAAVIALLDRSGQPLVEELLDDPRLGTLGPEQISAVYRKFPGIRRKLLVDWLYAQKEDPQGAGNSIEYFLTAVIWACDHATYREILIDARLPKLSLSILFALEQVLSYYNKPSELFLSFPDQREVLQYFAAYSKHELSEEAVPELIRFLRASAEYIDAQHAKSSCRPN